VEHRNPKLATQLRLARRTTVLLVRPAVPPATLAVALPSLARRRARGAPRLVARFAIAALLRRPRDMRLAVVVQRMERRSQCFVPLDIMELQLRSLASRADHGLLNLAALSSVVLVRLLLKQAIQSVLVQAHTLLRGQLHVRLATAALVARLLVAPMDCGVLQVVALL